MKILILCNSYPDIRKSASVLCTHRVLNYIANYSEHEVHVACYSYNNDKQQEMAGKIFVHRVPRSVISTFINNLSCSNSTILRYLGRVFFSIQKLITIPVYPKINPLSTRIISDFALELQDIYNFDVIVSEHHGLETLLAGCYVKCHSPQTKHIALLWDPIRGQLPPSYLPKSYFMQRVEKQEQYAVDFSDMLISTKSMQKYYLKEGDLGSAKRLYLDIPGVMPPDEEVSTNALNYLKQGKINIVFSGLLTIPSRDPRQFLNLISQSKFAKDLNLIFFCAGNAKEEIERFGQFFKGTIAYSNYIPLKELHTVYRHADYLLNISDINANMTPSKIFEYMSYGKPIISTFVTDGDAAKGYLDKYKESVCIDLKKQDSYNISIIDSFLKSDHVQIPYEEIEEQYYLNTPKVYLKEINKISSKC